MLFTCETKRDRADWCGRYHTTIPEAAECLARHYVSRNGAGSRWVRAFSEDGDCEMSEAQRQAFAFFVAWWEFLLYPLGRLYIPHEKALCEFTSAESYRRGVRVLPCRSTLEDPRGFGAFERFRARHEVALDSIARTYDVRAG